MAVLALPCSPANNLPAAMPSFDVVSEVDTHELTNAIDQANRELTTRFDFKGVEARFERNDTVIEQSAPSEFQLQQMTDILRGRLVARRRATADSVLSRPSRRAAPRARPPAPCA